MNVSLPQYLRTLTCPICQTHFTQVGSAIKCEKAHTFDIAKEGYINLLTKKLPDSMGDTREMLLARRAFLEYGHYQPLVTAITTLLYDYLKADVDLPYIQMLDVGCGEGYYLGQLQHTLGQQLPDAYIAYIGLDIAKEAMRMAAKRYKGIHFLVANLKERLVFANDTFHILLNIFAPRNIEEFARIITPGGIALVVIPAPQHLRQLRERLGLLNIEEHKQEHVVAQFTSHFRYLGATSVNSTLHLSTQEILQAVMMTPNYWHLSDEIKSVMSTLNEIETEIAFTCLLFQKDTVYKKGIRE
ncbi:MAG: 23S rRNA (guanine(745)-N(1))-methyltransferase [Ktedonobacteraceae bacterium]